MRTILRAAFAALALAALVQSGSTAPAAVRHEDSSADRLRVAPIFASIERGWVIGNVDSVLEHFGKRKVYISLPEGGPDGGTFSRGQSYFILKDLFDATRTEEFSFVSIRQPDGQPATAIGSAERVFRRRGSSHMVQDRIFVSLVHEDDRWVVAEIKSVP